MKQLLKTIVLSSTYRQEFDNHTRMAPSEMTKIDCSPEALDFEWMPK